MRMGGKQGARRFASREKEKGKKLVQVLKEKKRGSKKRKRCTQA